MAQDRKFDIDALTEMVMVFHLGLGQGRARRDAPINRFLATINKAFLNDVSEETELVRFVLLVESQVRIVPIAQDTEPLELRALQVDVLSSVSFASLPDCDRISAGFARLPHFLSDFE